VKHKTADSFILHHKSIDSLLIFKAIMQVWHKLTMEHAVLPATLFYPQ